LWPAGYQIRDKLARSNGEEVLERRGVREYGEPEIREREERLKKMSLEREAGE